MYNAHLFVYEGTGCGYLSVMFKEFIFLWTEDPNPDTVRKIASRDCKHVI